MQMHCRDLLCMTEGPEHWAAQVMPQMPREIYSTNAVGSCDWKGTGLFSWGGRKTSTAVQQIIDWIYTGWSGNPLCKKMAFRTAMSCYENEEEVNEKQVLVIASCSIGARGSGAVA